MDLINKSVNPPPGFPPTLPLLNATTYPSMSPTTLSEHKYNGMEVGVGGGYLSIITIVSVGIILIICTICIRQESNTEFIEYDEDEDDDHENKNLNNSYNRDNIEKNNLPYINKMHIDEVVIQLDQFIGGKNGHNSIHGSDGDDDNEDDDNYHNDGFDASEITIDNYLKTKSTRNVKDDTKKNKNGKNEEEDNNNRQESGNTWLYSTVVSSVSSLFVSKETKKGMKKDQDESSTV